MSSELFRRARRAEAGAARVEDRRRLRLEFFRAVLAEGLDSLKAMHVEGASGEESVRAHARLIDAVVQSLTRLVVDDAERDGLAPVSLVVVALGGYGRGELHPSSDIDLMVVYDGEQTPFVQRVMQELLYALWDLGFQVGHSLRSLEDCVAMARTDFPSRTSMQEARLIAGDRRLFTRFRRVLRDNVYRHDFGEFLRMTLAERDQRYRKFGGSSPYIGEPNVKESAGALRDMHTAMWLGAAKFGTRTLRELADKGLITPREQAGADAALTFLWRVRNELHFFTGHKNDVLTRDLQPRIAKNLGYENDGETLGVEQFMREYYLHARVIHRVSRRLIARCQETLSRRGSAERRERQQALADGLVFFDGRLHLVDRDGPLRNDPVRIMKVFRHVHRLGCELSLGLERALEDSLDAVDESFRRSPVVRDLFLDICRSWGRVAPTLSAMHELGLLGRYLPEFGALTCLVQYDVYHKFSADQHSLLAVQHLEALAPGQSAESEGAAQVFNEVERPELLMLGMLLHDIGKAKGHGHVAKGIPLVQELGRRMGLKPDEASQVEFLVAHHLTMSHIAQRRDIDDPKTIADFAVTVGDAQRLKMLYLLTFADMRAVGPGVLTGWQAAILHELYRRTLARLTSGHEDKPNRTQLVKRLREVVTDDVSLQAVKAHVAMVPERYLTNTSVQRMAEHLRLIARLDGVPVTTELFHHPDLGTSAFVVVTRDVPGLFSLIAGTLAAYGVNITSAQIATRADGIAIDTFQVSDPAGEVVTARAAWNRVVDALRAVLAGEQLVETLLARRQRAGQGPNGFGRPKIVVDNRLSDADTVIEVKCADRLGLLYLITRTLSAEGLDIASARIATEIDQAFDTFYVHDRTGRKLVEPAATEQIRHTLESALMQPV